VLELRPRRVVRVLIRLLGVRRGLQALQEGDGQGPGGLFGGLWRGRGLVLSAGEGRF